MSKQYENAELPPKSCSIERLVTMKEDVEKVIKGQKHDPMLQRQICRCR